MSDKKMNELVDTVREHYNAPGEAPREAMWDVITPQMDSARNEERAADVIDLAAERQKRSFLTAHPIGWSVAAAALWVMGVGIGRMTAPAAPPGPGAQERVESDAGLRFAAAEHFGQTESWLTMVQADARAGQIDPAMSEWARGLLTQTRMLMDAQTDAQAPMGELLEDLELVLMQIVGVTESESMGQGRVRAEMSLALNGLDDSELLQRLQAATPRQMAGA